MNTSSSPIICSSAREPEIPWTGFSLTLAVLLMLFLAFGVSAPTSPESLEPQTTRVYKTLEVGLLACLRIAAHQAVSLNGRGRTEALTLASTSAK